MHPPERVLSGWSTNRELAGLRLGRSVPCSPAERRLMPRSQEHAPRGLICFSRFTSTVHRSGPAQIHPDLLCCQCLWRSVGLLGRSWAREDVVATPMQCGGLWARAAPRRPGRGRDHPDNGRFRSRQNPGSPPGGGNVQDGVIEGLAAGVPRRNHSSSVLLLADPAPNRFGFHPSSAAAPKPGPAKPRSSTACQLLHDGMFRAAPHQNDARHVSGRR